MWLMTTIFITAFCCDMIRNHKHDWFLLLKLTEKLCRLQFYEIFNSMSHNWCKKFFLYVKLINRLKPNISYLLIQLLCTGALGPSLFIIKSTITGKVPSMTGDVSWFVSLCFQCFLWGCASQSLSTWYSSFMSFNHKKQKADFFFNPHHEYLLRKNPLLVSHHFV